MSSEHERDRIIQGAQAFYEMLIEPNKRDDDIEDVTLDHFMIVGIVSASQNDAEVEIPVLWCSTRRTFVQRGILETMLDRMRFSSVGEDYGEEEEPNEQ